MAIDGQSAGGQVQEFLGILSKRRWQILLPALFVASFGIVYSVIVPKKYTVSTRVEIREARVEEDYQLRNPQETSTARELSNAEHHIRHFGRVKGIIEDQGDLWSEYVKLDETERSEYVRKVIGNILVQVASKPRQVGSTFVDIEYSDVDALRAERFLASLTEVWIKEVIERDRNNLREERDVLQNQVHDASTEFRKINQQYIDLCDGLEIDPTQPLDENRTQDSLFRELDQVRESREGVMTDLAESQTELESMRQRLEEMPLEVGVPQQVGGVKFDDEIAKMETSILDLRREQARLTPLHSRYRQLESEIRDLEDRIEEAKALERDDETTMVWTPNPRRDELVTAIDAEVTQVAGMRSKIAHLNERLNELRGSIRKRTDDYRDLIELDQKRQRAREEWSLKSQQLESKESALDVMVEAWADPFEIVEPPRAGDSPSKPNPLLICAVAAFAGLAMGLGLALAYEFGNNAYRSVHEVSQVMAVPVLGTINEIVTSAQRRTKRLRGIVVGGSSFVIIGGLLWFSWIWSTDPDRLPVEIVQAIEDFKLTLM